MILRFCNMQPWRPDAESPRSFVPVACVCFLSHLWTWSAIDSNPVALGSRAISRPAGLASDGASPHDKCCEGDGQAGSGCCQAHVGVDAKDSARFDQLISVPGNVAIEPLAKGHPMRPAFRKRQLRRIWESGADCPQYGHRQQRCHTNHQAYRHPCFARVPSGDPQTSRRPIGWFQASDLTQGGHVELSTARWAGYGLARLRSGDPKTFTAVARQ